MATAACRWLCYSGRGRCNFPTEKKKYAVRAATSTLIYIHCNLGRKPGSKSYRRDRQPSQHRHKLEAPQTQTGEPRAPKSAHSDSHHGFRMSRSGAAGLSTKQPTVAAVSTCITALTACATAAAVMATLINGQGCGCQRLRGATSADCAHGRHTGDTT